ncbi:MAG: hypothetical protein IPI93_13305 [Sphingobacteriaceae bacterium]|nr:hypothetical protein [Sphingobacteriaceae bacterium]MBK7311716.1 hypothetical protein [Sphingobacteriaceae bacterium]MBK7819197.1 hypothetical protein [Sphingobacteriaceae bacterium]
MKIKMIATMLITFSVMLSTAQNFSLQAKSGDVELDASLNDINVKAKLDLPLFKKDLAVEFNIGEPKIDKLIVDMKMSPADAYMTLQVANMTKKEPDVVAQSYSVNKDKGWGVIAKEMGIKPGSPEFHALKGKAKGKKDKGNKGESGNGNGNGNGKGNGKGKKK